MLPSGGALSNPPLPAPFIGPRNILTTAIESWEIGGIALNDPSQGLMYQNWHGYVDSSVAGNIYLKPDNGAPILFLTVPGITQLSITFDQNMAPFLAFTQNGVAKFYWFDTVTSSYVTTVLDAGATTPCCSLDDKRSVAVQLGGTDILLFYLVGTICYYRQQRDRYGVEYVWDSSLGTKLTSPTIVNVGMNINQRFQVFFRAAFSI